MKALKKDRLDLLAIALMVFGGAVWCAYAMMRWGLSMDLTARQFLPYHLAGVVPGLILKRRKMLFKIVRNIIS